MKYSLPNEQIEVRKVVEMYKPFHGKNTEQMPLLLSEGRSPLWTARFMRRRIDHSNALPDLVSYLDTSDLIAYDSRKRSNDVKIILTVDKNGRVTPNGRKVLDLINSNTKLTPDYAVPISEVYDALDGIVVPKVEIGVIERDLKEKEILDSRIWRIVARNPDEVPTEFAEDKGLLKEYACWVKTQTKQDENMGVYLDSNSDIAKLKAAYVNWLECRSQLCGEGSLVSVNGRFVGFLAPEAPSTTD